MGGQISKLLSSLIWAKKEIRILILGLVSSTLALPDNTSRTAHRTPQLIRVRFLFGGDRTTRERRRFYID